MDFEKVVNRLTRALAWLVVGLWVVGLLTILGVFCWVVYHAPLVLLVIAVLVMICFTPWAFEEVFGR